MEKEIQYLLDDLDVSQANELLENYNIDDLNINSKALNKIKTKVFSRTNTNIEKKFHISRKFLTLAAVFAIVFTVCISEFSLIVEAFNKLFSFIPGIGITQDSEEILYILSSQKENETDDYILTINNAFTTKNNVTVYFSLERKEFSDEQLMKDKEKESANLKNSNHLAKPKIFLNIDGKQHISKNGWSAGGGIADSYCYSFDLNNTLITDKSKLSLKLENYNISCDFSITPIKRYQSLEEIGPTQMKNNICLTATAINSNGKLKVDVYPINNSDYEIVGLNKEWDNGYFGKDLYLQTDKGNKKYTLPDSRGMGINENTYFFDVSDKAKDFVLKIPYIVVKSKESSTIKLPIPKEGEVVDVNKSVKFKEGTAIITSVERTSGNIGKLGELKINLKFESKNANQQLVHVDFSRINSDYSTSLDSNGDDVTTTFYMAIEKKDKKEIKLNVNKPTYVFTDEFSLTLNSPN